MTGASIAFLASVLGILVCMGALKVVDKVKAAERRRQRLLAEERVRGGGL